MAVAELLFARVRNRALLRLGGALFFVCLAVGSALAVHAVAQPRLGDELVASPAIWRAFRPLVLASGEGDVPRAVRYLRAGTRLMRKADGQVERDAATRAFQTRALDSLDDFDLRAFFALLPRRDGPYRFFAFQGAETRTGYRFQEPQGPGFEVSASSARRGFGESSSLIRMRHVESEDAKRYLLQWRGGVGVGDLGWPSLVAGAHDGLAMLEERAPAGQAASAPPLLLRAADAHLQKSQPTLGAEDRRLLSAAWASFPQSAALLTSVGRTDDVVAAEPLASGVTVVHWVSRWDAERTEAAYPALTEFFRDLGDLAELRVRVTDASGLTLCVLHADTEHMRTRLEAFVFRGQLVPSRDGKPQLDVAPRFERMRAHVDLHFQAVGIHMYVDDLNVELSFDDSATGASVRALVRRTPRFRVRGAAFGFVPAGMLDWFIPGDIPGLARRMFEVATQGNEGRGIAVDVRFFRPPSALATVDASAGVEILDTALIRFGMKIAADRVMPDEEQTADIRRLAVAYRDAVAADIERFAKYGQLGVEPAPAPD